MTASIGRTLIRALVVDDEALSRANLTVLLHSDPDIELLPVCESGDQAIQSIRTLKPDLVFLDIQMPGCDGFDVLEMLGSDLQAAVVFVTAFDRHAIRAFEVAALDFLLKPFDDSRFAKTIARAKEKIASQRQTPKKSTILPVKSAGRVTLLAVDDVEWIEAADYYSSLHVGAKTYLIRRTMNELERDLDEIFFCRIHRSAIVNLRYVDHVSFGKNGEYQVALKNGVLRPLSRPYREQLQNRLGFHFPK
jgi:two-component system, LytTR family, response regulator